MRRLIYVLLAVLSLPAAFAAGYYYRATHVPLSAEFEDYALTNVLENVMYAHYLAKSDFTGMRSMIDVSLNTHVSRVRTHSGAMVGPEADAARTRILNAVAVLWERYPPFQSPEWQKNDSNTFWWDEWSEDHKLNLALVQAAKAKCAATPALNCKAAPPPSRLPTEGK